MKNKAVIRTLVLLLAFVFALSVTGCDNKPTQGTTSITTAAPTPTTQTPTTAAPKEVLPDVPANRYDATKTPDRKQCNKTSCCSTGIGRKIQPILLHIRLRRRNIAAQISLLYYNKYGAPEAGINVPSFAYDYKQEVSADNSTSTYTFILKNGITFSDGKPVTAKDVLFSIYVLCDPAYDGISTFYTMNIQGEGIPPANKRRCS